MTDHPFQTTEQFAAQFDLSDGTYSNFTPLTDVQVGFSVMREYPVSIPYSPPRYRDGAPDVVALITVVYEDPDDPRIVSTAENAPVRLRISSYSHFRSRSIHYDPTDENCPTLKSMGASRLTQEPTWLTRVGTVFYNHNADLFLDEDADRTVTGRQLLDTLFHLHCKTSLRIQGFPFRTKLRAKRLSIALTSALLSGSHWLMRILFGRELRDENEFIASLSGYSRKTPKIVVPEQISFFGYRVTLNTAITFSGLVATVVGIRLLLPGGGTPLPGWVLENSVISVSVAIFGVWVLDFLGPRALFLVMRALGLLRRVLIFREIEIQ